MESTASRAIAIVGLGAVLPDAPNVAAFWENVKSSRYSITDVTPDRWDPALYYDADPTAPDKSYSKIGGWVREYEWEPMKWHLAIPPRVVDAMDIAQKWAIACTRQALEDYGYPNRQLDLNRTAVILGNAMAGEKHYMTALRIYFPEYARELAESASFGALPESVRRDITRELHDRIGKRLPEITEDSMPGELANCIAGRIANIFNFHGSNYVVDAACASAMAAITSAVEGLVQHDFDIAVTGGIDRNMGASTFVKFCKIGALSATGTRPYAEGADGFVMGEGSAIFLLKRLSDAERDGDKIYAVLRGMGGSSDGKGKGITAPNPIGQKFAVERAWQNAGVAPEVGTLIEGHGTSTRVGDVVEVQSMAEVLKTFNLPEHSVALGSVKSNIGHLKGAAGAAGLLKATLSLHNKVLPPSVKCERKNPDIDFAHSPLYVNTELKPWTIPNGGTRRAGLSAFGFGGTNFHAVLEEYIPGKITGNGKRSVAVGEVPEVIAGAAMSAKKDSGAPHNGVSAKAPLRGAVVIGTESEGALIERLRSVNKEAAAGCAPVPSAPDDSDLRAPERIAIDYADAAELATKSAAALKAFSANQPLMWKALRAQGVFRGRGPAEKVAFLYTGQGSQYVNMLKPLRALEPIVADTFAEADRVMTPLLGKPLSEFIFVDGKNNGAMEKAEEDLRQTAITQPAVLATDEALTRLLAAYGITPDFTMGHSLGEYGALVASGALPFAEALEAVSARGREMTRVSMEEGRMAAVFAPLDEIERIINTVHGNVVIANVNSEHQAVIGGARVAVEQAIELLQKAGYEVTPLSVSQAFHTSIVAPASEPLRRMLTRLHLQAPRLPIVANVNGEFYPSGGDVVAQMLDILARQVAAPVQFVKGLRTLYDAGARVFVEVGPKKALQGFAEDVLGRHSDVLSLFTNHPKFGDVVSFNQALCGLYAAGLGRGNEKAEAAREIAKVTTAEPVKAVPANGSAAPGVRLTEKNYGELGRMFAEVLERGWRMYQPPNGNSQFAPVVITGAALGLPGSGHIFDDGNLARILRGDQFIDSIPTRFRQAMLDKHITRLVKSDNGGPTFETINNIADVIKLAGRGGSFDLEKEFGVPADRIAALDRVTALAIGAGIDALRDAGIPLVMRYKTTSKGTQLPDRWSLPDSMRDDTGVIFGSAFPGLDSFAEIMSHYFADQSRREQLSALENLRNRVAEANGHSTLVQEIDRRIQELRAAIGKEPFVFDRRFLFRILSMGHSQFAEYIGARGPNTQVNAACASTTQAVSLAEDWIRAGRCRRVIILSADDITSDNLIDWMGAGFLASGAAATDDVVADAAIPFDRRRHGMIIGMGAAALVIESAEAAHERGLQPICEVLSAVTANSAFHGTRLDVQHISQVMEEVVAQAEKRCGIERHQIAPRTVFVSHETYTPARGGSASAEIHALRHVFGDSADQIVIANTKGFTGHAMATGIEDVVAIKSLETGCVPPVPNFREVDPELGVLNLSKGGNYPVEYALRLGAGFGSQISMTLVRWVPTKDQVHHTADALGFRYRIADQDAWDAWLKSVAGPHAPDLEVVNHTLRIRNGGVANGNGVIVQNGNGVKKIAASAPVKPVVEIAPVVARPATPSVPISASTNVATAVAEAPAKVTTATPTVIAAAVTIADPTIQTSTTQNSSVKDRVLSVVSEKTGYPIDMLDLDLDLEADLGVDTVKQAEVLAAIRESYSIARDDQLKLRDFPTLAHVIRFVYDKRPDLKEGAALASGKPSNAVPEIKEQATPVAPLATSTPENKEEGVKERILALVVEKTGYPQDMLDLELDLEADLGIDTVKQAEMFAAIREIYNIPRDENRKLRDYPTLNHVIRFVYEKRPDLATGSAVAVAEAARPEAAPVKAEPEAVAHAAEVVRQPQQPKQAEDVKDRVLALVVEKTGYPQEMLDLDLDLEADLGIDTVKQAEMFAAIREIYSIPRDENRKLRDYPTLAHVIRFVYEKRPDLASVSAAPVAEQAPIPPAIEITVVPEEATTSGSLTVVTPPSAAAASDDAVREMVLAIVAEKTGYPKEMLDLDLDLEADLGIDTVKQAEMFAAVRAAYNIPRDETLKLRDFPTLGHVIKFAIDRQPGVAPASAAPEDKKQKDSFISHLPPAKPVASVRLPLASFDAAEKIPRRVPVAQPRPPLTICKATGATLETGRRVVIMPDKGGVGESLAQQLTNRGVEVLRIDPTADADVVTASIKRWLAAGPIHGVYWLPALDYEGRLGDMNLSTWHDAVRIRVKLLYAAMRSLYEQIAQAGTFLVTATRLGGQHGYDVHGAVAPLGGAVAGFTKAYKRERPDALVKAVDFEAERASLEVADLLIAETLRDPGAIEIGYTAGQRWTVGLEEQPAADGQPALHLDRNSVFLITGAAGSIVSAITTDLAAASGGTFYLLDLVPEPKADDPHLKRFVSDKDGLKRELFTRIQARGERATPALVEKELAALERALAAQTAIDAVKAAGGTPYYFSVNLTETDAVAKVINEVRQRSGRVDVLLHAAGIERSHFLPDKDPREFDLIFDVKCDGFFNLLHALGDMPLGATVAFSSIAGRFGNAGQADYSSANDLLCKITSSFRSTRPATRGIAIDWTAWGGIGMATRGSIPKMMELAGIDMLPPEAGIPLIRRELTMGGTRGEIVVAQRLGVLMNEFDAAGGIDANALPLRPMLGKVASFGVNGGITIDAAIDPSVQPFLYDHKIDGTAVLPGVMGIEAFAEAASVLFPGWKVEAVENVSFLAPFKFYRNEARTVSVHADIRSQGEALFADCELTGSRLLPNQKEPQVTKHFTGRVRLTRKNVRMGSTRALGTPSGQVVESDTIYGVYFHGPAYQVLERAWWNGIRMIGLMAKDMPPNHEPAELKTVMAPRLIELCFQTAGLWELGVQGRMGLPQQLHEVRLERSPELAEGRLYATVMPDPNNGGFDVDVIDAAGNRYVHLSGYRTVALPGGADSEALRTLQSVMSLAALAA
jgi:acyl transferase domain-containing protein/acyl carrier protein/NAD(P)-dependent dehydrogenase (short-subunit alcohol dehydrogenase family)